MWPCCYCGHFQLHKQIRPLDGVGNHHITQWILLALANHGRLSFQVPDSSETHQSLRQWKSSKSPKRRFSKSDILAHALPIMTATEPRLVMSIYSEHIVQSHRNMCHLWCPVSATTFTHTYHPDICVHIRPAILYTDLDRLLPKVEFNACNRDTQTFYSPHLPTRLDRVHLDMVWPHHFGMPL